MEIKSKSRASGGWGFVFHITKIEGLLEETENPKEETNNAKVCSPRLDAYHKKGVGSLKSPVEAKQELWLPEINQCRIFIIIMIMMMMMIVI